MNFGVTRKSDGVSFTLPNLINAESIVLFYTICFAAVHVLLLVVALFVGSVVTAVYQIIPICLYFYLYGLKSRFMQKGGYYYAVVAEMIINAFICTVFLGPHCGIELFLLVIPANSYFLSYHMRTKNFGKMNPLIPTLIALTAALLIHITSNEFAKYNAGISETLQRIIYAFNVALFFGASVFIMLAFYASINAFEHELELKNEQLDRAARTDFLTGALNRGSVMQRFEDFRADYENNRTPFCAVLGDIDDFKNINDSYGHGVGDSVIVSAADMMFARLTEADAVCRWGGEEFLILLHNCRSETAKKQLSRLASEIAKINVETDIENINFTMTFGVADYTGGTLDDFVKVADERLYYGKNHGKNTVITIEEQII
jgi:diguanylate cyclase (GGDEF)-like protein